MQHKVFRIERAMAAKREPLAASPRHDARDSRFAGAADAADDLAHIHDTIARHRRDLAALIDDGKERRLARAASELCAAVDGMEKGAETVLKSAESIDDSARALSAALKGDYERSLAQDIQDHVVRVYEACNFQDLAGQRIGKVVAMLTALEDRLAGMLARDGAPVAPTVSSPAKPYDALLNGPRLDGEAGHASQRDIDVLFGKA